MCWFNKKKDDEKEQLQKDLSTLKLQMEMLQAEFLEFRLKFEHKIQQYDEHLENDKDLEEGNDELVWKECN